MFSSKKRPQQKPRFKRLSNAGLWYFDDGRVFICRQDLESLYDQFLDYKKDTDPLKWSVMENFYDDLKRIANVLNSAGDKTYG